MGPQNTCLEIGISARLAAAAVSRIGRARLSEASNTACHWLRPCASSAWISWTRMIELRIRIPISARMPRIATKPMGTPKGTSVATTPMRPRGAAAKTISDRRKLCVWIITSVAMISSISGTTAAIGCWLSPEVSTVPPTAMRTEGGRLAA